ncbi:hypothetical protein BDV32DRAFT_130937 [Aspergillus pseudonomiae]|uniref:Uncharacterized protein n=1 Tax=Aspergillus pseudonomiae TaxID=1506151 RepID=A0A5N7DCE6_9EURO|nr:uncharacterized protein BDV37DRAFT_119128 [Aspergillus pseudonomiae]KAB8255278.1 hypothetical protein BDV32DRAFT_130937 [Aspergillus pseudonomiae]KAE8404146.1 hypothetical protein BDV37DRAFT_119128 [Aspergillus pseudonomiae]
MFGFSSKRPRGHEELADFASSAIHERKKHRSLALRTSPHCSQKLTSTEANQAIAEFGLSTLTPVESSDDDDGSVRQRKHVRAGLTHSKGELPHQVAHCHASNTAMDIDHDRDMLPPTGDCTQYPWPTSARGNEDIQPSPIPHSLVNQYLTISERHAATSAYGYFPPMTSDHDSTPSTRHPTSQSATPSCFDIPRPPSPVSDSEDAMASIKDTASDVDMAYNPSRPASFSPSIWIGTERSSPNMQEAIPSIDSARDSLSECKSKNASSKKKITISMGFRADCEKCRCKVPGHYSHIIRT